MNAERKPIRYFAPERTGALALGFGRAANLELIRVARTLTRDPEGYAHTPRRMQPFVPFVVFTSGVRGIPEHVFAAIMEECQVVQSLAYAMTPHLLFEDRGGVWLEFEPSYHFAKFQKLIGGILRSYGAFNVVVMATCIKLGRQLDRDAVVMVQQAPELYVPEWLGVIATDGATWALVTSTSGREQVRAVL